MKSLTNILIGMILITNVVWANYEAHTPTPEDGAQSVDTDVILSWHSGDSAALYDVYLGSSFYDVNEASRDNPLSVRVSLAQDANAYNPWGLQSGTTYYWRIDSEQLGEIIIKGDVWSFTTAGPVEPEEINHHPGHIIVKIKGQADPNHVEDVMNKLEAVKIDTFSLIDAELWDISGGSFSVVEAVAAYVEDPSWVYFEPDYMDQFYNTPNDPNYPTRLWGLPRICAEQAWDYETGDDVIIAVIDSGVDYTHPDLAANMWINPGETLNGLDDDGNGYVDDIYGCDCGDNDGDPMDEYYHGTHMAGIIAACGNNGIGITGVSWHARIMALKICDVDIRQYKSYQIKAIEYAVDKGAKLSNNSWGSYTYSQALYDAIRSAGAKGHLFVAAAGNDGIDIDGTKPVYPASHDLDNIISVTATNQFDNLHWFSNYGLTSVDLGAPGINIFSTFPTYMTSTMSRKGFPTDYMYRSGTSQAAPYVTGAASLIWSRFPTLNYSQVKRQILNTVEPLPSLAGKTVTGGILSFCQGQADRNGNGIPDACETLVHSYTFRDGTANDSIGSADGTLVGGAAVVSGALVTSAQGQWMEMPGNVIAMNTFNEVTIEAWYTPTAGANGGYCMLAYFGDSVNGLGSNGYYMTSARANDESRTAISIGDIVTPWASGTCADGPEYDDGHLHHMVSTIDGADITLYIDGVLYDSALLDPHNSISGISQNFAYLAKSGYDADPEWIGSIEEFNIYNVALSAHEVAANYAAGPQKVKVIPVDPGTNGLIANYAMENCVSDSSGNGLNGTILGNPNFVTGHDGMALDLDGNGDYVDCGYDSLFDVTTNEITVSAWVTIRSIANEWAAIAAKGEYAWRLGNASWDPRFHFGISIYNAPDTACVDGVTAVVYDEWHHAAGVFDGSNIMVYLDGVLDVSVPTTEPIGFNNANMLIGDNPDEPGRYWDGLIDELKIYDRALSTGELIYLAGFRSATKPIAVENFSFELPGTVKIMGWNGEGVAGTPAVDVPGWSSDTAVADSGVESDWTMGSTEGAWTGFIMGADPSVWNLTNHVIGSGEEFLLQVDLQDNWTDGGDPDVTISLYYDDAGTRVTVASTTVTPSDQAGGGWSEFSLTFTADNVPGSVGKLLGIEIDNVSATASWVGIDNVRLNLFN